MRSFLSIILSVVSVSVLAGQSAVLTNDDVLKLTQAGIPALAIQSKIKTSTVKFDTSTDAILVLSNAKVADIVIASMIERQAEMDAPKRQINYTNLNPEYGALSEIAGKNKAFIAVHDPKSRTIILGALKKLNRFQFVETREEADFGIAFDMRNVDAGSNIFLGTAHNVIVFGRLYVYTYLATRNEDGTGRIRILLTIDKKQDWSGGMTLNRHPAQNAVNDLVKAFKKL